jgi:hypothetical protein
MASTVTWVAVLLSPVVAWFALPGTQTVDVPPTLELAPGADETLAADLPILEHEAPVLAALEERPDAADIPLRARVLDFPHEHGRCFVAFVADLPAAAPSLRPSEGADGTYTQVFTVLALVRDEAGEVVHRASRHYDLSWPESRLGDLKVGRALFAREAVLSPGRYAVEIVARDAWSGALGVTRVPLELPADADARLRLSSLVVVGHTEGQIQGGTSPLLHEGVRFFPNLGDPVSLGAGQPLAFLFTVRPGGRPLASATIEVRREGTTLAQTPVVLPAPDPSGQMRVVSGLPIGDLEPGDYTLRLSVSNAQGTQTRSAPFTLVP